MTRAIPLLWYDGEANVGDVCSPAIVERLTSQCCRSIRNLDFPHLVCIGSLISLTNEMSYIWGSGLGDLSTGVGHPKSERIWALRGKLTMEALRRAGTSVTDIPLGDPAFLFPKLYGIRRVIPAVYELGIVPHYIDRNHPIFQKISLEDSVLKLDVALDVEAFVEKMSQCKNIVSSSLHGLIFAEALNIPNVWMPVSNNVIGGGFKFRDWFSTTQRPQTKELQATSDVKNIIKFCEIHESNIVPDDIISAFHKMMKVFLRETQDDTTSIAR